MANTSAAELLSCCLAGKPWPPELLHGILAEADSANPRIAQRASREFFTTVVERLGDLFEPALCQVYAGLFAEVIAALRPELGAAQILDRYSRVRQARKATVEPANVYVLSRITLGADVAVTSVVLDGVKRRYPAARIWFVGPRKNWELFAADNRVEHYPFSYGRGGTLRSRIESSPNLFDADGIVVDPDSRLTQLGLLPVCPEIRYFFFESRAYGGQGTESLSTLTRRWMAETFDVEAQAFIDPLPSDETPDVTISFGVGENLEKRIDDPFEEELLRMVLHQGRSILMDKGAPGEEMDRANRAIANVGGGINTWEGDYAPFASRIQRSRLYIGYDSAGQHVAAACGVPLISVFAGFVSERMFQRWRPTGPGPIQVIQVLNRDPLSVLQQVANAIG